MADYHSPTVVTENIPINDMTPLERLLLQSVFDEEVSENASYFHSWRGPSDVLSIDAAGLRIAWGRSRTAESRINGYLAKRLEKHAAIPEGEQPDEIDLDLTGSDGDWSRMLQDIVRRSATLDEIVVTAAFTCTKMKSDGFGGSVMRITAADIQYASTVEMLEAMRNASDASAGAIADDGHDTRALLESIANEAGWDSFTLLLLVARWMNRNGHTQALIESLSEAAVSKE